MVTLLFWTCATTAMLDCQVEVWRQFEGPQASFLCESVKQDMLEGRDGGRPLKLNKRVRLECEPEIAL